MMEPLIIHDQSIAAQLRKRAEAQHRTVEEVLLDLLQEPPTAETPIAEPEADSEAMVRKVRLYLYDRARQYWRETGNEERLALTDEQLDEQFWLFDPDGVPRLKSEMDQVEIPEDSLYRLGEALEAVDYHSGRSDIATNSKQILRTEYADYILRRRNRPNPNVK